MTILDHNIAIACHSDLIVVYFDTYNALLDVGHAGHIQGSVLGHGYEVGGKRFQIFLASMAYWTCVDVARRDVSLV